MEQVAADLPMELIFSQVSIPRGRGKIERFFRSVDQLLLQDTPGYAPKGSTRGNIRLIERLMTQVEHILVANPAVSVVTKEAVETARENLIIGLN